MKLSFLVTLFASASPFLPLIASSPVGQEIRDTTLTTKYKRQVLTATVCVTINLGVTVASRSCTRFGQPVDPNQANLPLNTICRDTVGTSVRVNVGPAICLCANAGVLTESSTASLNAALTASANAGAVARLTAIQGGALPPYTTLTLPVALIADAVAQIGNARGACSYPPNSIVNGCTADCAFTCASGYFRCGNQCTSTANTCVSGVPKLPKRDQLILDSVNMCPGNFIACAIPGSEYFNGRNFECIDPTSDLESCGACAFPLPGQKSGIDCAAIQYTTDIECVSGKCLIKACVVGFKLDGVNNSTCLPDIEIDDKFSIKRVEKAKRASEFIAKRQVRVERVRARREVVKQVGKMGTFWN